MAIEKCRYAIQALVALQEIPAGYADVRITGIRCQKEECEASFSEERIGTRRIPNNLRVPCSVSGAPFCQLVEVAIQSIESILDRSLQKAAMDDKRLVFLQQKLKKLKEEAADMDI